MNDTQCKFCSKTLSDVENATRHMELFCHSRPKTARNTDQTVIEIDDDDDNYENTDEEEYESDSDEDATRPSSPPVTSTTAKDEASLALYNVIDNTTLPRLQALIKTACEQSKETREIFEKQLMVFEGSTKRQKRFEMCKNCKVEFDVKANPDTICRYHPGTVHLCYFDTKHLSLNLLTGFLDVDYDGDFWADHDERCHGTIDSDEMRSEYPEGFRWDCCERLGNKKGCKIGKHEIDTFFKPSMKRKNVWDS